MIFKIKVLSVTMNLITDSFLGRTPGMNVGHKLSDGLQIFTVHQFQIIRWIDILQFVVPMDGIGESNVT